jgi:hypothetical protein
MVMLAKPTDASASLAVIVISKAWSWPRLPPLAKEGAATLTLVKVFELVSAVLLIYGRYVNLALTLLGPIVVNILIFHVMIKQSGHALSVVITGLALVVLIGQKNYLRTIFAK